MGKLADFTKSVDFAPAGLQYAAINSTIAA
jgi:hypothetical protein